MKRVVGLGVLAISLGCSRASCSRSSRPRAVVADAAPASSVERIVVKPEVDDPASPAGLRALRERRWADAETALADASVALVKPAQVRLVRAFALSRTEQFGRAWALLQDLEADLPELTPQILRLRAETGLYTQAAGSAADWLVAQGEPQAHVQAAKTYLDVKNLDAALTSATRAVELLTPLRDDVSRDALAEAHRVRAQIYDARGASGLAAADWFWLQAQSPTHWAARGADGSWEKATGRKLSVEQRLSRAVALAKAGLLRATESELEQVQALAHAPLVPGYSDWLLGRARSRARVEHLQGARMLERSVKANVEDADSLRLEAARLYLRGGKEREAIRVVEPVIRRRGVRSAEAQTMAARAYGIMGDYAGALRTYDALLGSKTKPRNKEDLAFEQAVTALLAGQCKRALAVLDAIAQSERRESLRARAAELAGVAALELDRRDEAVERFRAVLAQLPFTLGAWLAAERLKSLHVTPAPAPIPALVAPTPGVLSIELPRPVAMLHELGLVDYAALALAKEEAVLKNRMGQATAEFMCKAYGAIGTAGRRFEWAREGGGNIDLTQLPDTSSRWRWDCRFPQPYSAMVEQIEKRWKLPRGLLYAIMRQESTFHERVRSSAGAVGLTQLMPKTAERLLTDFGPITACGGDADAPRLDEPRCNLELGARYLRGLLDAFGEQLPMAVLSYNAGPEVVNRWAQAKRQQALDLFLAQVPFAEPRNYVHHVLTNFLVYHWLGASEARPALPELASTPIGSGKPTAELY